MSAFYSLISDDRISLLTDGAVYEPDGTLTAIRSKVWTCSEPAFAMTGRGNINLCEAVARSIRLGSREIASSFDEVLQIIDQTVKKLGEKLPEIPPHGHVEMLAVGWTKAGPMQAYFTTRREGNYQPFRLYQMAEGVGAGPEFTMEDVQAAGITEQMIADAGCELLDRYGAQLFDIMRNKKGPNPTRPELPEIYGIGGFVELTTVKPDGVTTRTLREWPDVIGEKINPFAVPQPMSRQQKRALDRRQQKIATA
jgi:hypothetical protein